MRENKKISQNSSFLNKTVFKKSALINNKEKINQKDNILFNNYMNGKKLNRNNSLLVNKNCSDSIKSNRLHRSNSINRFNKFDAKHKINKKNIKGIYINKFLKAFNNSVKSQNNFSNTHREYKK